MTTREALIEAIVNSSIGDALGAFDPGPRGMSKLERIENAVDSSILPALERLRGSSRDADE